MVRLVLEVTLHETIQIQTLIMHMQKCHNIYRILNDINRLICGFVLFW